MSVWEVISLCGAALILIGLAAMLYAEERKHRERRFDDLGRDRLGER